MFGIIVACLFLCLVNASQHDGRIIGGATANIEDFPYQLSVRRSGKHTCGASIISANWALTASHCVYGHPTSIFELYAGSSFRTTGGTAHKAVQIIMHPKYNHEATDYDYTLIKVSPPFPVGSAKIKAVKLANKPSPSGTLANVTGWGITSGGAQNLPDKLWKVQLPVVSKLECQKDYPNNTITDRMLCAGYPQGGKDTCLGDSGGPFVANGYQIGIVSWGYGCALPNKPGIYADVFKMLQWIKETAGL